MVCFLFSRGPRAAPPALTAAVVVVVLAVLGCCTAASISVADPTSRVVTAPYFTGRLRESGRGWPACDPGTSQWSGYFDIPGRTSETRKHYFYWAFAPRNKRADAPVILWMTGGPGCSSTFALLTEVGPCWVNATTGDLDHNAYAWNNEAYVVFVDQPAGVGFSYAAPTDYNVNSHEVGEDMYNFMQAFLTAHAELRESDFFVVGESYGGHYAPATAHRIMRANAAKEGPPIRLAGMAAGNGLTNSVVQYPTYADMAYTYCREQLGAPCVTEAAYQEMRAAEPLCKLYIDACNRNDGTAAADACRQASWACGGIPNAYRATGLNPYDIRKECKGELCYDLRALRQFMNRADVKTALGVDTAMEWQTCSEEVGSLFGVDWFKNFNYTVPDLLSAGVRVMVYAGDMDFICNWIGNERWTLELEWDGQAAFRAANEVPFRDVEGAIAGTIRAVPSATSPVHFSFVRVFGSGHMVPMDTPSAASALINNFIYNRRFT